jgi:hypothetical protein
VFNLLTTSQLIGPSDFNIIVVVFPSIALLSVLFVFDELSDDLASIIGAIAALELYVPLDSVPSNEVRSVKVELFAPSRVF